jgi:acylphosphatase
MYIVRYGVNEVCNSIFVCMNCTLTFLLLLFLQASRFRNLVGTMSPPEEGVDEAEIYIEGTRKMVNGFIRWAEKGDVGLSVYTKVTAILEEEPTGLYDDFYVKTK